MQNLNAELLSSYAFPACQAFMKIVQEIVCQFGNNLTNIRLYVDKIEVPVSPGCSLFMLYYTFLHIKYLFIYFIHYIYKGLCVHILVIQRIKRWVHQI